MNLQREILELIREIGPGRMMTTAYDTAWLVRMVELGDPVGQTALAWLREHQWEDGSWGAPAPYYHHDRFICTLAAINALARQGRMQDRERIRRAEAALHAEARLLDQDPAGETIGFELIVPTLLAEAKALGAIHRAERDVIRHLTPMRAAKLARLPHGMISRHVTVAFSAEMAGMDGKALLDVENLQEANGSVGLSPSATAYFALYIRRGDPAALAYLRDVVARQGGQAPNVAPFDIFEQAWSLWNLHVADALDNEALALCQRPLDFLEKHWEPGDGVAFSPSYTPKDSDDTVLAYDVLTRFGRTADLEAIFQYEEDDHFRCFGLESNPSVSANIHILGGFRQGGLPSDDPRVEKIRCFLQGKQQPGGWWVDKWHASPYYATSQAILAGAGYVDWDFQSAIDWILRTQRGNGAWGHYEIATTEETAYSLQSLAFWKQHGGNVPADALKRGSDWLAEHADPPYAPLWISKCLYCPELVVRSAALSALVMATR